jgi:hypothetical protein
MATAETAQAVYSAHRACPDGARGWGTGKPDEIETTHVRFGERVLEKCRFGNSPPPYSTARPV